MRFAISIITVSPERKYHHRAITIQALKDKSLPPDMHRITVTLPDGIHVTTLALDFSHALAEAHLLYQRLFPQDDANILSYEFIVPWDNPS